MPRKERPGWGSLEKTMNQDRIQGRWKQLKGKLKEQWGRLTDDDLDVIAGRREQLLGRIQQRHGLAKDGAGPDTHDVDAAAPAPRADQDRAR
jgi:uncharacterized protein YjbJ (UPF0337 family)